MKVRIPITFSYLLILACLATPEEFAQQPSNTCAETDYDCQIAFFEKAIKADPAVADNHFNLGLALHNKGRFADAVASYDRFIAARSKEPKLAAEGYNNRAVSNRAHGQRDAALKDWDKAIELDPTKAQYFLARGGLNAEMQNAQKAVADYDKAIALDPKLVLAYAGRGNAYALMKDNEKALIDLDKAIELDPTKADPYYNRAVVHAGKREFTKAVADYDKFISIPGSTSSRMSDAYLGRAIAVYYTGDANRAIQDLTKSIEANPKQLNAYKARAAIYRQADNAELAAADEKKIAELEKKP